MTRGCVALLLVVLAACAPARDGELRPASETAALPACGKPPSPAPDPAPAGALIPPRTRLTAVRPTNSAVQLTAYVQSTPQQIRAWVLDADSVDVQQDDALGDTLQMTVVSAGHRVELRIRAVCQDASLLSEVISQSEQAP